MPAGLYRGGWAPWVPTGTVTGRCWGWGGGALRRLVRQAGGPGGQDARHHPGDGAAGRLLALGPDRDVRDRLGRRRRRVEDLPGHRRVAPRTVGARAGGRPARGRLSTEL